VFYNHAACAALQELKKIGKRRLSDALAPRHDNPGTL
jgi:hypothetical protein